jgi:pilus assembly protein CpaC
VLLRVRFAEVSRSAITDLGASLFTGAQGYKDVLARTTTSTAAPVFDTATPGNEKLVFSDFLNLFLFDAKHQLGTVIKALQTKGQFQILAEPNLVAESGKEASFLAGGEFPVPVAQGSGNAVAISVQYKEFGVRLNFTPVINGDRVHLKVRPEVSTLDFANGVLLQGFRIPALSTRRTETELELQDGQTFAIAGLLNNSVNSTLQKIPGIGDIPILGLLFKSKAANKEQSELVVMITPQILTRDSSGVTTTLPKTPERFMPPIPAQKLADPLPPAFTPERAREGAPAPARSKSVTNAAPASTKPSAAEAAATVGAIMRPKSLPVVVQGPPPPPSPVAEPGSQPSQQPATADVQSLPTKQTAGAAAMPKMTNDERKALEHTQKQLKKDKERMDKLAREAKKHPQTAR